MIFLQIIGAVLVLSFLIFIHELGHFWAAKKNGVKVEEFAIGFPPTLWKKKKGDTVYKINLIPFGGYVKLFGEDSFDEKVVKDKKSFASKTPWQKIEILIAGVVMNFLVFWIFSSVAIMNGAAPFIFNSEQLQNLFLEDKVNYEVGFKGEMAETAMNTFLDGDISSLVAEVENTELEDFVTLPVFYVNTVDSFWSGYLNSGDYVVLVNNKPVVSLSNFENVVSNTLADNFVVTVFRDNQYLDLQIPFEFGYRVESLGEGVANTAGVRRGDVLKLVNDKSVNQISSIREINLMNVGSEVTYSFLRNSEQIMITMVPPENGITGMSLVPSFEFPVVGFGYSLVKFPFTINEFNQTYSLYQAPFVSLQQGWQIAKLTAFGFVGTIFDVFFKFEVSDEIGGPVQVVKLSYEFVGLGGNDLLNFIALISLSLAVINLLPIPALDGGRILFVLIEALRGKPLDRKLEASIHGIGFALLMTLILVVTIFDFLRL